MLFIFENKKTFQNASYAFDLRRRNGVQLELLNATDLKQIEPMSFKTEMIEWNLVDVST